MFNNWCWLWLFISDLGGTLGDFTVLVVGDLASWDIFATVAKISFVWERTL